MVSKEELLWLCMMIETNNVQIKFGSNLFTWMKIDKECKIVMICLVCITWNKSWDDDFFLSFWPSYAWKCWIEYAASVFSYLSGDFLYFLTDLFFFFFVHLRLTIIVEWSRGSLWFINLHHENRFVHRVTVFFSFFNVYTGRDVL